jgi:hypothetical protein
LDGRKLQLGTSELSEKIERLIACNQSLRPMLLEDKSPALIAVAVASIRGASRRAAKEFGEERQMTTSHKGY